MADIKSCNRVQTHNEHCTCSWLNGPVPTDGWDCDSLTIISMFQGQNKKNYKLKIPTETWAPWADTIFIWQCFWNYGDRLQRYNSNGKIKHWPSLNQIFQGTHVSLADKRRHKKYDGQIDWHRQWKIDSYMSDLLQAWYKEPSQ